MIGLEDFSRVVAGIYAAALNEDGWVAPLNDIRRTVGAQAGALLMGDGDDRTIKSASLPAEVLDAIRHALIVLDSDGSIIHMNNAAAGILAGNDGLRSRLGTVEATRPATNSELHQRIGQAVRSGDRGYRSAATMTCSRPSGKWPYVIHILPLRRHCAAEHHGPALLLVIDPAAKAWPPTDLVRRLFGMTRAEAEVAVRVLDGDGLKPIADRLNLSPATVKTHLQHVFDKTGTHRQAELVRLLLSVIP